MNKEDRCVGPHKLRGGPCLLVDCPDCSPECGKPGRVMYRGDRYNLCDTCPTCFGYGRIRRYRLDEFEAAEERARNEAR
jgi:hypothetical protein